LSYYNLIQGKSFIRLIFREYRMKKIYLLSVFGILFMGFMPVSAQQISEGNESEYYYVNVPLERIYPSRKGYVVAYRKGVNQIARAYLPEEWFTDSAGKGEIITLGPGNSWPYLTVYYKDGEFSHVRLYVRRERSHETWGSVPSNVNIDEHFENVDDLKLEF
jgi:hypothetical protein